MSHLQAEPWLTLELGAGDIFGVYHLIFFVSSHDLSRSFNRLSQSILSNNSLLRKAFLRNVNDPSTFKKRTVLLPLPSRCCDSVNTWQKKTYTNYLTENPYRFWLLQVVNWTFDQLKNSIFPFFVGKKWLSTVLFILSHSHFFFFILKLYLELKFHCTLQQ